MTTQPKLCIPVTDVGLEIFKDVRTQIGAIEYKNTRYKFEDHEGLDILFESPYGIISDHLVEWIRTENTFNFLDEKQAISFSCDFGPSCRTYKNVMVNGILRSYPVGTILSEREILSLAVERCAWLRSKFAGILKFEILNFYPTGVYEHVCKPDFISLFLENVNGELLLDLGHARVSSENMGVSFDQYLDELPLERVSEIHFSKAAMVNGVWEDAHELPVEEDYKLLESLIEKLDIRHIVVEYYKDSQKLVDIFNTLYTMFRISD